MKWANKGHEFDAVYENIAKKKVFYLFGAGEYGEAVYQELKDKVNITGFLDNNEKKQACGYLGEKVYPLNHIDKENTDVGIIVTVSPYTRKMLIQQLMTEGFRYNQDFFTMEVFMSVYYAYKRGELYIPSISFLPSTRCNLNCEACLNFTPYMKEAMVRSWDVVKADVDEFFRCVDYIMLFHISGGEPLLYPHLAELVEYIGTHYRHKIHFLRTVTNGTVLPKKEVLEALKKYRVDVTLDDYREAVPQFRERFQEIEVLFQKYEIPYEINKVDEWIDLAPMTTDHTDWTQHRLEKQFEGCHVPWQELRGGKIYSCNYASYAIVAGFIEEQEDEVFDLQSYDKSKVKELMEFRMGYNAKGYVEFCRRCSGYVDINTNIVPPAKQKERQIQETENL